MLFIVVLRMVVFVIFWVVGFDFWIFPNFFDEYAGILDSFLPFYTFERRLDDLQALAVRAADATAVALPARPSASDRAARSTATAAHCPPRLERTSVAALKLMRVKVWRGTQVVIDESARRNSP